MGTLQVLRTQGVGLGCHDCQGYGDTCEKSLKRLRTHISRKPIADNETVLEELCGQVKAPIVLQIDHCGDKVLVNLIRKGADCYDQT